MYQTGALWGHFRTQLLASVKNKSKQGVYFCSVLSEAGKKNSLWCFIFFKTGVLFLSETYFLLKRFIDLKAGIHFGSGML